MEKRPGDVVQRGGAPTRMKPSRLELLDVPLDPNQAAPEELESLPGIGPALARRIIAGRPYASLDALAKVRGIGGRRLTALGPRIVFFAPPASAR